jgi:hypothetical protein
MMPDARGVYDPENQGVIAKRQLRRLLLDCVPQAEKSQAGRPDPKGWGIWPLRIRSSYGKSIILDV